MGWLGMRRDALLAAAFVTATLGCGTDEDAPKELASNAGAGAGGSAGTGDAGRRDGGAFANSAAPQTFTDAGVTDPLAPLELTPQDPVLTVTAADPMPSVTFEVQRDGVVVDGPTFSVIDADFGAIDAQGLFTASGATAGQTMVEARVGENIVLTSLTVRIEAEQNGAEDDGSGSSSGGYGGVGGEGPGGPVTDASQQALDGTPETDGALSFLYPYDETVLPLGLLAPLLQWTEPSQGTVDAIKVHLSGQHYDFNGYYARPPALADADPFVRHPIPQEVWDVATRSTAGGTLEVELTVEIAGQAYGPITRTLRIANGILQGTVYYQSYGTDLVKNYDGAVGGDGRFGGATLAIEPGETGPRLIAGADGGHAECRVCHSVASRGARMIVQHGDDYPLTSSYDLLNGNAEQAYPQNTSGMLGWLGMTPDGELGLGTSTPLGYGPSAGAQLYDMQDGSVVPTTGLTDFVTEAGFPAFSHDGTRVAFNFRAGPGDATIGAGDAKKLVMMDFDRASAAFSNPTLLHEDPQDPGWPSFTPDGNGVVFQALIESGDQYFYTREGGKGELWWTNLLTGTSHRLDQANGTGYLPTGPDNHDADQELNYEPTVAPIAAGGYAWVVFTSRRRYGNVATIDPWRSDPRDYDHTQEITTKKLWVAAVDLNVEVDLDGQAVTTTVGDDPSHPPFYLPGQELHAGNTRGYWVVDPCRDDGMSCDSGVECCSGRCQVDPESGERTCGPKTGECALELDACDTSADCCDQALMCIGGVCTQIVLD
jgi:hypothetical protein